VQASAVVAQDIISTSTATFNEEDIIQILGAELTNPETLLFGFGKKDEVEEAVAEALEEA